MLAELTSILCLALLIGPSHSNTKKSKTKVQINQVKEEEEHSRTHWVFSR